VEHEPLIVPRDDLTRFREDGFRGSASSSQGVTDLVVELQQRDVRLRDDEVLVVAMIADQREAFRAPGKSLR